MKKIIVLDIGDAKFSAIVADQNNKILKKTVIGSQGVFKGVIRDQSIFLKTLCFLLEKLNEKDTRDLIINLQATAIKAAEIDVIKKYFFNKKQITEKIKKDFAELKTPINKENILLNYYPQKYFIEANTIIQTRKVIYTDRLYYDRLKSLIKKAGYNMVSAVYPFVTYPICEKNTAIINLGANIIEIILYKNKILEDIIHLPIGGETIIRDMVKLTKIDADKARSLLFAYENIFSTLRNKSLSQSIHHQIIDSHLKEIFNLLKKILQSKNIQEVLLVGGLRNLHSLPELLGNYLNLKVNLPATNVPHFYVSSLEIARHYYANLAKI